MCVFFGFCARSCFWKESAGKRTRTRLMKILETRTILINLTYQGLSDYLKDTKQKEYTFSDEGRQYLMKNFWTIL